MRDPGVAGMAKNRVMTSRKIRSSSTEAMPHSVVALHVASANGDDVDDPDCVADGDDGFSHESSFYYKSGSDHDPANLSVGAKIPVARTLSNRSSQQTAVALQPTGPPGHVIKSRKLGHRRVNEDGEVTYKKFETTQLIGSIQLGIHFSVGQHSGIPDRDILMEDFLFSETVSFTRDGLLQNTPKHQYSDFRFRTYAPYAFRFFRHLFEIDTDLFLASLCSEPMVELANPGVSGSIFYVTRDDNFICKTVQHKEADFLQKLLPGYYLNLQQNPRTLLPKFFGFYCYSCNAKNVRLVIMNNLLPSGLRMHHKFDLKGSTCKRKANRRERAKQSPTYKDLDFMEIYPDGILLQPDIYENLMNSINRDVRVLESFKIMDYSLLIGIHNLDQAARGKEHEFDGISDMVAAGDNESLHTADKPSLDRQGSIQYRERMIAHSTALESITMEIADHGAPRPSIVGGLSVGTDGEIFEAVELPTEAGLDNVWGGIPAKNHRGENLLLFIGIIDILQEYGVAKKMEHYWKSLIHDGDTVSVHRPSFYARRFKQFMGEKVFRKLVIPLRSGPSIRRTNLKRALSKETSEPHHVGVDHPVNPQAGISASGGSSNHDSGVIADPVVRGTKEAAVTVITIGSNVSPAQQSGGNVSRVSANEDEADDGEVCLPVVLQDRKRMPSATMGGGRLSLNDPLAVKKQVLPNRPDIVATCSAAASKLASSFVDDHDTGSIITMTSDERVQIYVPSPLETTPYNTITRHVEQVRISAATTWSSGANVTVNGEPIAASATTTTTSATTSSSDDVIVGVPFNVQRVTAANSYRSLTPLNMDLSEGHPAASSTTTTGEEEEGEAAGAARGATSNETSLEMIHFSLTSVSEAAEMPNVETELTQILEEANLSEMRETAIVTSAAASTAATTTSSTKQNSLSDPTIGPELPSLPCDPSANVAIDEESEPVSLSHIQLEENIE